MNDDWIVAAVVDWSGRNTYGWPTWDDNAVVARFGGDAPQLLSILKSLKRDFYDTNAYYVALDREAMERQVVEEFHAKHPDLPPEIADCFRWAFMKDHR